MSDAFDSMVTREDDLARAWRPQKVARDLDIVRRVEGGARMSEVARLYGISHSRVREIILRHRRVPERLTEAVPDG